MGKTITEDEIKEILDKHDLGGEGYITFDEFKAMLIAA